MFSFVDQNGLKVTLSFEQNTFSIPSKHVLVLANSKENWLLTKHPKRGIEFPGGKVEKNETLEEAAMRETYEETGATLCELVWFAEYMVFDQQPFCKTVYRANVESMNLNWQQRETEGPLWLTLHDFFKSTNLSFHMRDEGMRKMLERVINDESRWNDRT